MASKLTSLRFDQAANLVDDPANPKARIVLFKRAPAKKEAPAVGAVHVDTPDWKKKESPMKKNEFITKLKGLFKSAEAGPLADWASEEEGELQPVDESAGMLKAFAEKLGAALAGSVDGAGMIGQFKALHQELSDKMAEAESRKVAAAKTAEAEAVGKEAEAEGGRVTKAHIELSKQVVDLQKKLDATEARAVEAETIAKAERATRELETEKTALRKFKHVTIDVDKDAAVFTKLRASDPAAYDLVMAKLNGAEAVAQKSGVIAQDLGSPQGGTGATAWAEIEAEASKIVEKGEKGLTQEKAIDRVMKARPELVARYKAEQAGQVQ
jgi:hypothetical protein